MNKKEIVIKIREQVYVSDEPFQISDDEAEELIQLYSDQQNKELRDEYNALGVKFDKERSKTDTLRCLET